MTLWEAFLCTLRGHKPHRRAMHVSGTLYTWARCKRCGRHLWGTQPPWGEMLSRAVNKSLVTK